MIDPDVVREYADLIREGVQFPPVRVWWDGNNYWLTDGFHRLAAAEQAAIDQIAAEVCLGSLEDAQWDSCGVNACHGVRRTGVETEQVVRLALQHPRAAGLSNVAIAKHLHMPETTLRRWLKKLSSPRGEDTVRTVSRGGTSYPQSTARIGKGAHLRRAKSREDLRTELAAMKAHASPTLRRLLTIIDHWALGPATAKECAEALEHILAGRSGSAAQSSGPVETGNSTAKLA